MSTLIQPTSREILAMFFGSLQYIDEIPTEKKTGLIISMAKKMLNIEEKECLEVLEALDGALDFIQEKTKNGGYHENRKEDIGV